MKSSLKERLQTFDVLTEAEIERGLSYFKVKEFKKDEFLISAGEVCDFMAFVNSGHLRNFYISSKDEEITYCLSFPNQFVSAFSSFISRQPTFENIHGLTAGELLVISHSKYYELMNSNKKWLQLSRHLAEQSYIEMENRLLTFQMESAKKRYRDLLEHQPQLLQNIPLKYLASYLGISQRHLSRLRKDLAF